MDDLGREPIPAVADFLHSLGYRAAGRTASLERVTMPPHEVLAQAETHEPTGIFRGVFIKAIDPRSGALTLAHEEIKGLMPAMEMMYRVKSRVERRLARGRQDWFQSRCEVLYNPRRQSDRTRQVDSEREGCFLLGGRSRRLLLIGYSASLTR
jgi:Copper binding periplasmic protein CusF